MPPTNEPAAPASPGTPEPVAPAVTPDKNDEPAVTPKTAKIPEGYQLIKDEDVNKLKSKADKAPQADPESQGVLNALLQKDAIRDAMAAADFKENYPDVSFQELLDANPMSDQEIVDIAKKRQAKYEEIRQKTLKQVQVATTPTISQADKETQLADLAKPAKRSRFQEALRLTRTQVKN